MSRLNLLRAALPLVRTYGFTREALARSAFSLPTPHTEPLSDTAVTTLFGDGDEARRTLINAWLDDARAHMQSAPSPVMKEVLSFRLRLNEPVLDYLPEAFALLISPTSGIPPVDLRPALKHAATIADEACHVACDVSVGPAWYARRASLATIYTAAELHQLNSPNTAYDFLGSLLESSSKAESALTEAETYARYIGRSWAGLFKSSGVL